MKNLKKIVMVMICIWLVLTTANIAYAQVNASGQIAVSLQSDDLKLPPSSGTTLSVANTTGATGRTIAQIENNSTAAPITVIAMPINNAHIYNTYTVTGTVSDAKMRSWELEYGAGSSPTSWKIINSGTTSIVNGTLGTWYIGSFTDGSAYTLQLTATDSDGNTSKITSTITIDSTIAPHTDMSIPNNTSTINGTVSVLGTVSDMSLSSWKLDYGMGKSPTKWTALATGTTPMLNGVICQWDTGSLKNGQLYTVRLSCIDQSGNYCQTTKHLTKNTKIPAASISMPANNAHISGAYTVNGSVSGIKLDFWELDYGAGNDPASWSKIKSGTTSITNGTLGTWNTSSLVIGSVYTLQLTVADLAGHRIQSVTQVTIDKVSNPVSSPITTIISPANNSNVKGNETVTGTVSDTNMGRWTLEYASATSPANWTEVKTELTPVTNGELGSWDTSTLAAGIYILRLREVDVGGNVHQTTVQVTVGAPTTNLSVPTPANNPNNSGVASATGTATDANTSSWISEGIGGFVNGLGSFFQQAFRWITGK